MTGHNFWSSIWTLGYYSNKCYWQSLWQWEGTFSVHDRVYWTLRWVSFIFLTENICWLIGSCINPPVIWFGRWFSMTIRIPFCQNVDNGLWVWWIQRGSWLIIVVQIVSVNVYIIFYVLQVVVICVYYWMLVIVWVFIDIQWYWMMINVQ